MAKYIDAEKLKAEIERHRQAIRVLNEHTAPEQTSKTCAIFQYPDTILSELLSFIDTLSEEPDKSLEEAAEEKYPMYWKLYPKDGVVRSESAYDTNKQCRDAFIAGAQWQVEQFEKNRITACDKQTKEEYDREVDFATGIIEKEHRNPTFSDAINYGIKWQKEKMLKDAVECVVCAGMEGDKWIMTYIGDYESMLKTCKAGDKVRIIIVKEENK